MEKKLEICYQEWDSLDALSVVDRQLMNAAIEATESAYSPYSHFSVGAAVLLSNGAVVKGSNQENVAYPSGLCAERTALFAASSMYPGVPMACLAIVARNREGSLVEASPCGACRQVMAEFRMHQSLPLRVLAFLSNGGVRCYSDVNVLLPFSFEM